MNNDDAKLEKGSSNNNSGNNGDSLSNELSSLNIDSIGSSSSTSRSKKKKDTCLHCLKQVDGCSRCSQCRTALYCNRVCQLKHWPAHKNICQDSNNAENSDEKLYMKAKNHYKQGNVIYIKRLILLISYSIR